MRGQVRRGQRRSWLRTLNCVPVIVGGMAARGLEPSFGVWLAHPNTDSGMSRACSRVYEVVGRLRQRAARKDDAARPAPESRRFGHTPAPGLVWAPKGLSPMPGACGSGDNIRRIVAGARTGFAH